MPNNDEKLRYEWFEFLDFCFSNNIISEYDTKTGEVRDPESDYISYWECWKTAMDLGRREC